MEIYLADSRGFADHGWLKAKHSFSFASYYDPSRVHFGMLRVLNDDIIAGRGGFPIHPHDNMEIVTIPLNGELAHKDSMGHTEVITSNEIQVMSAGTGITHSEFNNSETEELNLFQIWVFPREKNITPRYDQKVFDPDDRKEKFHYMVGPDKDCENLIVNQDVYFSRADMSEGSALSYDVKRESNGIYLMVIEGSVEINREALNKRDAAGFRTEKSIDITASSNAQILVIDVPMR